MELSLICSRRDWREERKVSSDVSVSVVDDDEVVEEDDDVN